MTLQTAVDAIVARAQTLAGSATDEVDLTYLGKAIQSVTNPGSLPTSSSLATAVNAVVSTISTLAATATAKDCAYLGNAIASMAGTFEPFSQNIVSLSGTAIDCSLGNYFTTTINANTTFTITNAPSSRAFSFTIEVNHTSGTITWPASVVWPYSQTPTLTTGKTHLFTFLTDDAGTKWRGAALASYTT